MPDEITFDAIDDMPITDGGEAIDETPLVADGLEAIDSVSISDEGVTAPPEADVASQLAELRAEREQLRAEREAYQQAIQNLRPTEEVPQETGPLTREEMDAMYQGKDGYEIIQDLARKEAQRIVAEEIESRGLSDAKETQDAMIRQYQIQQAQSVYPDLPKYKDKLVTLSQRMEETMDRDAAMKFSVVELMHMIKGNELAQKAAQPKAQRRQAAPAPQNPAAVRRTGANPGAVADTTVPGSMAEAFQRAKKEHGITAEPGEYRVPAQLNSPI